jgi:hypothetical protein
MQGELVSVEDQQIEVLSRLTNNIPMNEFGMPTHVYRPDCVPYNFGELSQDDRVRIAKQAEVPLFYSEGFPTTSDGRMFWDRLEYEGEGDFMLFEQYRRMQEQHGFRSLQILAKSLVAQKQAMIRQQQRELQERVQNVFLDVEESPRSRKELTTTYAEHEAEIVNTTMHLRRAFVFYCWAFRCEAFDMVGQAAIRKVRATRAVLLEDQHFGRLGKVVDKCFAAFENLSDEAWEEMKPGELIKVLKDAVAMQRITVGLPGSAPADSHLPGQKSSDAATSLTDHLRSIAAGKQGAATEELAGDPLENEALAEMAQDLQIALLKQRQGTN